MHPQPRGHAFRRLVWWVDDRDHARAPEGLEHVAHRRAAGLGGVAAAPHLARQPPADLELVDRAGYTIPLAWDGGAVLEKAFALHGFPTLLVIDKRAVRSACATSASPEARIWSGRYSTRSTRCGEAGARSSRLISNTARTTPHSASRCRSAAADP